MTVSIFFLSLCILNKLVKRIQKPMLKPSYQLPYKKPKHITFNPHRECSRLCNFTSPCRKTQADPRKYLDVTPSKAASTQCASVQDPLHCTSVLQYLICTRCSLQPVLRQDRHPFKADQNLSLLKENSK